MGLILAKASAMRISIPLVLSSRPFIPPPRFLRSRRSTTLLTPSRVFSALSPALCNNYYTGVTGGGRKLSWSRITTPASQVVVKVGTMFIHRMHDFLHQRSPLLMQSAGIDLTALHLDKGIRIPNGNKDHGGSQPSPEHPKMHSGPPREANAANPAGRSPRAV